MHKHRCKKCDTVWEHEIPQCSNHIRAHRCPSCGKFESARYFGLKKPEFTNHHVPATPVQRDLSAGIVDQEPPF